MHKRVNLLPVDWTAIWARWSAQNAGPRAADAFLSRFFRNLGALTPQRRPFTYKLIAQAFRWFLRGFNRLQVRGTGNVPPSGAIFYCNHPGVLDPVILVASLPVQLGGFIWWGTGWFSDMLEQYFGFISYRPIARPILVEKMVRQILCHNRYFAIWPEGHPTRGETIKEGFSAIVRVYAVVNAQENRVPFVPVLLRGSQAYLQGKRPRPAPIAVDIFKPVFLPRAWLAPPSEGGRNPRQIIDTLMLHLARQRGQHSLTENNRLTRRRKNHQQQQQHQ